MKENTIGSFLADFWLEVLLSVLVPVVIILCIWAAISNNREDKAAREKWFAECTQHEPNYKCVALWRAGENHSTPIPVFIPIPTGR